jgi:hypothetical protein
MKGVSSKFLAGLLMVFAFAACSKQPVQEIIAARAAVDAAIAEGAEKYSPAEARKVNDELAAAIAEANAQDSRFLKDYKKAKEMLAGVQSDAEALKAGLASKKREAKTQALAAWETAKSAVEEARSSLIKAARSRQGNGTLDALDADAKVLDENLLELRKLIDTEDYTTALEKAGAVKENAAALSEKAGQISAAAKTREKTKIRSKNRKHS